jgi:molybdopterin-containing oxidoreductase family iron-sulfur binding subunit
LAVCPVEAIIIRDDGIIAQDNEKCIGCQLCLTACPYEARVYYENEPEYPLDFKFGDWDAPSHEINKVEKCTFCANRIDRGDIPACMELCPGRARYWGDIDDPGSEISVYLEGKNYIKLLEEKGTEPNVFFVKQ